MYNGSRNREERGEGVVGDSVTSNNKEGNTSRSGKGKKE